MHNLQNRGGDRKFKRPFGAPGCPPSIPRRRPRRAHGATPRSAPDVGHTPQDRGEEGAEVSHWGKAAGQVGAYLRERE
jgi:hypothetical protein